MTEATSRPIGVVDQDGAVIASSDLSLIGSIVNFDPFIMEDSENAVAVYNGKTFKPLGFTLGDDYALFTEGEDDLSKTLCIMASIAINEAASHFEESNDKRAFVKNIISENILPGDIYVRAKELRFSQDVLRGILVIRMDSTTTLSALELLQEMFPNKQSDYIVSTGGPDIVLVKEMPKNGDSQYLLELAEEIEKKLYSELAIKSVIGVGTPARHLRELAEKYKEAIISIDVGAVFETDKTIINYETLGIGRLIYQLPTTLCEMFLSEIFKRSPIETLDRETLHTIDKFFENSLNVSETSRKLFVHRNTLVYRLEKIRKLTGLDLREFEHAIVFKVALMVKKYLVSQETKNLIVPK